MFVQNKSLMSSYADGMGCSIFNLGACEMLSVDPTLSYFKHSEVACKYEILCTWLKNVPASRVNVFQKHTLFKPYSHWELQAGVSLSEPEFMEYLNTVALLPPVRMWSCSAPVSITHSFVVLDISLTSLSFMNLCCEETSETKQTSKDMETVCNHMDRSSIKPMTERQVL